VLMQHPAPIEDLPAAAQKALRGAAPLRMMVARGMAPLPPPALVGALYGLAYDADGALADAARASLEKLPDLVLDGALRSPELPAAVLDDLAARFSKREAVVARVIEHPNTAIATMLAVASHASEATCEHIATNEQRLLEHPALIEALYMNRALRMSTADRIVELAARNGAQLSIPGFADIVASLQDQLIPLAGEETPADQAFREAIVEAEALAGPGEDVVERDEDGDEALKDKFRNVEKRLVDMSVSEKIRTALIGNPAQRAVLVRSSNRIISLAAIGSPKMSDSEAAQIAASRQVSDDILRHIANKREWMQLHQVKVNLCFNPKTPVAISLRLLPFLRENDLKTLMRSKNVPQALKTPATQLVEKRGKK